MPGPTPVRGPTPVCAGQVHQVNGDDARQLWQFFEEGRQQCVVGAIASKCGCRRRTRLGRRKVLLSSNCSVKLK